MAGALAGGVDYDEDGYGDDYDEQPVYDDAYGSGPEYDQVGPLSGGPSNDEIDRYNSIGQALSGTPEEISGALSQQRQSIDAGYAQKQAALARAMAILRASGQGQSNLPMMLAGAALMGPQWSFGEGVQNAVNAAAPAIRQQRQDDLQRAMDMGRLDVESAGLDIDRARANQEQWLKRQDLGERYLRYSTALRDKQAQIADAKARQASLDEYRKNLIADREAARVAREKADKEKAARFDKYVGTDPETGNPVWANDLGQTKIGDKPINAKPSARSGAGGGGRTQYIVELYTRNHQSDIDAGIKTKEQVQQEALDIATGKKTMTPQQALSEGYKQARAELLKRFPPPSSDEIDARAHEIAQDFMPQKAAPQGEPGGANTRANPGFKTDMPLPQGTQPSPLQIPQALRKIPPQQLQWNAALQQYRDKKTGTIYDATGKKVQ